MFRGKCDDKWHFGDLLHAFYDNELVIEERDIRGCIIRNRIVPATVGQFTGLVDSTGKDVYEGDIVASSKFGFAKGYEVKFAHGAFVVDVGAVYEPPLLSDVLKAGQFIVGNVHDSPELLEATHV